MCHLTTYTKMGRTNLIAIIYKHQGICANPLLLDVCNHTQSSVKLICVKKAALIKKESVTWDTSDPWIKMFYEIPLQEDMEKNLFCGLCPDKYQCRLDPKPFSISNWTPHFFSFYFKNVRYKEECNKHQYYAVLADVNVLGQGTLKL